MVYDNQDLEEENREQSKEKRQARIIAGTIGQDLDAWQASPKKQGNKETMSSCFKCKKGGHWATDYSKKLPSLCPSCKETGTDPWH